MSTLISKISKSFKSGSASGFTLLEVLISVAILGITLTVLYGSQSQSISLAAEARFYSTATFLAGVKLSELENGILEASAGEGDFGDEYQGYKWELEIEDVSLAGLEQFEDVSNELQRAVLTVTWGDSPFSHSLEYLYFDEN